mgnify:CR=1 FL=1
MHHALFRRKPPFYKDVFSFMSPSKIMAGTLYDRVLKLIICINLLRYFITNIGYSIVVPREIESVTRRVDPMNSVAHNGCLGHPNHRFY